jgi:protein-disulfide isomerase
LRVVYKQYPLRGSVSVFAAKAALAANKQGKYLPFHIALMQQAGNLDEAKILALAKTAGVDVVQLNKDMAANSFAVEIANAHDLATKIAIPGTPALFFAKTN